MDLAQLHDVHPTQITAWKAQLMEGGSQLFGSFLSARLEPAVDPKTRPRRRSVSCRGP